MTTEPNWIEVNIPFGPDYNITGHGDSEDGRPEYENSGQADSISARGLNKAGVLLDLGEQKPDAFRRDYTPPRYRLIGHVNESNGGCGCCSGIDSDAIVIRYAVIWEQPQ